MVPLKWSHSTLRCCRTLVENHCHLQYTSYRNDTKDGILPFTIEPLAVLEMKHGHLFHSVSTKELPCSQELAESSLDFLTQNQEKGRVMVNGEMHDVIKHTWRRQLRKAGNWQIEGGRGRRCICWAQKSKMEKGNLLTWVTAAPGFLTVSIDPIRGLWGCRLVMGQLCHSQGC